MNITLEQKIEPNKAYITGASSGIGAAFAKKLAKDHDIVIIARDTERLNQLAEDIKKNSDSKVDIIEADLTKSTDLKKIVKMVTTDKNLSLLVNNAGYGTTGKFVDLKIDQEINQINLNIVALVRLTHAALTNFKSKIGGAIINVASIAGFLPAPYNATYAATKSFVRSFTEAIHKEYKDSGIVLQTLCPGFTKTEFQTRANFDESKIPGFLWMDAADVVKESLEALEREQSICIPGLANKSLTTLLDVLPKNLVQQIADIMLK
ncbi:MAG: SDR family oxidoreductase [Leptospiraceae bacterium]|nr:SDR family oxidoreductase [Leptospiraceae bacterium]MCP5497743.1 SDR family oxidoreductase [Leptospiraceae bacterium]